MSECGCRIEKKYKSGDDLDYKGSKIVYCPKHQAVDRLLQAAREAQRIIGLAINQEAGKCCRERY